MISNAERQRLQALGSVKLIFDGKLGWVIDLAYQKDRHCPFLSPDNLCAIYEQRPNACRTYPTRPMPDCLAWPLDCEDLEPTS